MPVTRTPSRRAHPVPAARAAKIEAFAVMDVLARAQAMQDRGRSVIHLEIGEPDFTAAPAVVRAGIAAIRAGSSAYTPALGLPALREAIAKYHLQELEARVRAQCVAVTTGVSGALSASLAMLVHPGADVLVPDPGYPAYRHLVRFYEGRARRLPLGPREGFRPSLDTIRTAWKTSTKGMIIGTPANPTGAVIPYAELQAIARFVAERGGWMVVDEIYLGLAYTENRRSIAGFSENVIVVGGFSKYFDMTGWRLGWAVLPARWVRGFEKILQHVAICAPTVAQHAALAVFRPDSIALFEKRRREMKARRDLLVPRLRDAGLGISGLPEGAFYAFADCSGFAPNSNEFTRRLLEEEAVAATPGTDFGRGAVADRHVRFAWTRPKNELEEAAVRIARFCDRRRGR